jgi:hypothetical protein
MYAIELFKLEKGMSAVPEVSAEVAKETDKLEAMLLRQTASELCRGVFTTPRSSTIGATHRRFDAEGRGRLASMSP